MGPDYFSQLFKQSTGRAPYNYVLLKRIERAKEQLCNPQNSVMDAALGAGFQNPSHCARVFRQLVGATPSQFRHTSLNQIDAPAVPERDSVQSQTVELTPDKLHLAGFTT